MLYVEPYAGVSPILNLIQSSRRELSVGVYYLSSRPILRAIEAARRRGVDVRVMVEEKPYRMSRATVSKEARAIQATGAALHWAPSRFTSHGNHYAFLHAKYVCNGHACEIGTANYDWSAFHRNREYLYVTKNSAVVKAANAVFNADWTHQRALYWAHRTLVLSPGTSASQLLEVINQPGQVDIESEEMGPYQPTLDAIARKGNLARVILPASINSTDKRDVEFLESHGVQVHLMPVKPDYMHAKMMVGNSLAFVGSENFTQTSLEANREMGLLLNGNDIPVLKRQFDKDWQASNPA